MYGYHTIAKAHDPQRTRRSWRFTVLVPPSLSPCCKNMVGPLRCKGSRAHTIHSNFAMQVLEGVIASFSHGANLHKPRCSVSRGFQLQLAGIDWYTRDGWSLHFSTSEEVRGFAASGGESGRSFPSRVYTRDG